MELLEGGDEEKNGERGGRDKEGEEQVKGGTGG